MTISIEQIPQLKELIEKTSQGETVVITKNDKAVAELRPLEEQPKRKRKFGACKGMLEIISDDDEHLKDFEEYM